MAQPLLVNKYYHRKTADPKACWICFKPSTSVLITPDNKDFFYICAGHLKDRGFAIPDAAEVAAIAERQAKADLIKQGEHEYAEMQKAKKQKEKDKKKEEKDDKEKSDDKSKDKDAEKKDDTAADQPKSDEKTTATAEPEEPRTFALHRNFYQQRLDRIRNAEIAKRNRERLKNPALFPSVPTGAPGQPPSST